MRRLEVRQMITAELSQPGGISLFTRPPHDKGLRCLAPPFMRQPDHGRLQDGSMPEQHPFGLNGGYVFAHADDDVLPAVAALENWP